jgi:hypothetical protein
MVPNGRVVWANAQKNGFMKILRKLLLTIIAVGMASTAVARNYDELVAEGYRWATTDGPYACPSKDDLRDITQKRTDEKELYMVGDLRAYYLIRGAIVKVLQEDTRSGMTQIQTVGIPIHLWTLSKFLSKHPIKDAYAVIETPESGGLIPTDTLGI